MEEAEAIRRVAGALNHRSSSRYCWTCPELYMGSISYLGCHTASVFIYGFNARIPTTGTRASLIFI
jgi:hypothetical protein